MIKPWIFEFFAAFERRDAADFDPAACARDFAWYLAMWARAEQQGFEGIFFSEHHFIAGRYSPSPNLLIAAVAARTKTLRLGTMGNVVPFYEPWRLAEEYSMLDQLSGGRLEIGLSSGIGPREYRAIGMSGETVRRRFAEALDVIEAALTQPAFSHQGQFWKFDRLGIVPRPLQQPAPPRWMTGLGSSTAVVAARRGCKFCTGFIATEQVRAVFDDYLAAADAAGHLAGADQLGLRRMVVIADSDVEGKALGREALLRMRAMMSGPPPSTRAAAGAGAVADAPMSQHGGPVISDDECIAGSPATVAAQIIDQCRRSGAGHLLAFSPGALTRDQAGRSFDLWGDVIPLLRRAHAARV